jgi:hypothetical protein
LFCPKGRRGREKGEGNASVWFLFVSSKYLPNRQIEHISHSDMEDGGRK